MKDKLKNVIYLVAIILIIAAIIVAFINHFNSDGMKNTKEISIYYKTYTEKNGWSKWSKNGVTSGDFIYPIKGIMIKVKTKSEGKVVYKVYSDGKWSNDILENSDKQYKNINAIKFAGTDIINRKYNVYYRTYNKENKWLNWTFDGEISGNKNKEITAIEIKIIPKNVMKYDYLKDYNQSEFSSNIGF